MKAWQVTGAGLPEEVMASVEREIPTPGPGELQVKVAAAGMGLPDVFMCKGTYPLTPELPFTPGQELVGIVSAVGEGCSAEVGQRVMGVSSFFTGNGAYAEYCIAPEFALYSVGEEMTNSTVAATTGGTC